MSSFRLRQNPPLVCNNISTPLTGGRTEAINLDSAFYGFSGTVLTQPEITRLIDSMRRDEVNAFEDFRFERIQHFRANVILSQLPEEVSAVHICGALGDYAGLRKLLKANFNLASQDIMGRTALHYATQTNLPMVVMLLSKDPTLLCIQDKFGKLPVDYCLSYRHQDIFNFLNEQLKASSSAFLTDGAEAEMDVVLTVPNFYIQLLCDFFVFGMLQVLDVDQRVTENNLSIALNFEAYLCTQIKPLYCHNGQTYCECCDDVYSHEVFSGNAVLDELVASRKERFIKRPTNTFGQFETPCSNVMAEGSTQVEFPQRGPKTELHTPLAPYHTRYLFVDSGPKNGIHCIQEFRTRMEAWLSTMTFCPNSCDLIYNTPVCGILVAGRPEDALGVCEALKCNIPFVVVAVSAYPLLGDSGGLASIIDQYLSETKYMREISQPYTNEATGILEADHERLLEIMMRYWPEATLGEDLTALVTTIIGWSHLMQFFFAESDSDASLDGKIVSALINPALFQGASKKQSWKPRLNLAMELNKTDIVLEGILDESSWTLEEISPFVKCCLLANKPRFLRLFCDAGLQMYEFADQKTVEELFTIEARSNTVEGRALKQFFLDHLHKMPSNITVGVAKQTLKIMMGRKYFTHAVRSDRRSRHVMRKLKEASLNQQADATIRSPYLHENESYLQYLYLWALASKRYEIARYLLMMLTDITAAALFGASFLRRKARIARSPTEIEESHYYSLVFENIALSILNQCYSSNAERTMQLLIMERQTFEQLSCFVIAAEGNCKHFMEHQACQEYLDRVWARTLLVRDISIKFFFSLFVGIVCPPAIPFIADYDESKYAQKYSDNVDDVAYTVLFCLAAFNLQFEFTFANYSRMAAELTTIVMTTAHFIDHVKNALTNWASCRDFISQRINQFSLVAFAFYAVGVSLQVIFTLSTRGSFGFEQFSRISLAFGASIALQQLLQLLSIHHYIGPKLQMIRKMGHIKLLTKVVRKLSGDPYYYGILSAFEEKSFRSSPTRERQLINWEKLNALIVTMGENYNEETVEKRSVERSSRGPTRAHQEGRWHLFHRLRPADIRTRYKKTMLEQKIENIDEALESIMAFVSPLIFECFLKPHQSRRVANSLMLSRQSLCSGNEDRDFPVSFQWQNHQVAFYATLTSDITPRSLDPPIPWDVSFPEYSPIRWQPSNHQIPAWEITIGETSLSTSETSHAPCRLLEVDATAMTTGSKTAPQNPEGRVGIAGKGLLPQFGGNSTCIVVVERCGFNDTEEVLLLRGVRAQAQFPWFLYQHGKDCSQISCYKELVRGFCEQIVEVGRKSEVIDPAALQRFVATYNEHIFKIKGAMTTWARLDDLPPMRKSHLEGLKAIHLD
ncbi:unnamed protein product [Taenia asiatica]|uniref:ANK_REP_REGION domain-containing protein n=1 Tax=Taenia asiatica TaxID=60517 RepID=A0A158R6N0_TAEAS|nr:unnamed protein product [Taenia asiatica]